MLRESNNRYSEPSLLLPRTSANSCPDFVQLHHLLDLKQKQASLDEATSASQNAKTAAIQGQAILLFTIVTVIFVSIPPSALFQVLKQGFL